MRVSLVCLMMVCTACGQSSAPVQKPMTQTGTASPSKKAQGTTEAQPAPAANNQPAPSPAPQVASNNTAASQPALDYMAMESKVRTTYAQNPKISAKQADTMTGTSMSLIKASNAGDQASVSTYSGQLLNQALLGSQGFGLVDGGALAQAIQDLVKAAKDADVDGILKAVKDITDAT